MLHLQGKSNSLFAGKTAFDGAVETPVDALAPGQGVVHESAFSKATDIGTAPAVASDSAQVIHNRVEYQGTASSA